MFFIFPLPSPYTRMKAHAPLATGSEIDGGSADSGQGASEEEAVTLEGLRCEWILTANFLPGALICHTVTRSVAISTQLARIGQGHLSKGLIRVGDTNKIFKETVQIGTTCVVCQKGWL